MLRGTSSPSLYSSMDSSLQGKEGSVEIKTEIYCNIVSFLITSMDLAEVRPDLGPGPRSGEKSEKSRPESLDLGSEGIY